MQVVRFRLGFSGLALGLGLGFRTFAALEKRSRKSVGLGCFMSKLSTVRISFSMSIICARLRFSLVLYWGSVQGAV